MNYNKEPTKKISGRSRRITNFKCKSLEVDSPIAKYNSSGDLTCVICRVSIKTNVWKVHLNSKLHKQNVALAKEQRIDTNSLNSIGKINLTKTSQKALPALESTPANIAVKLQTENSDDAVQIKPSSSEILPEKFFDQEKSAAVVESDRDLDTEWLKFKREIREAATVSNNLLSEELDFFNNKNHLKEMDEQIENWRKFIKINERKNFIFQKQRARVDAVVESSSEDEGSVDDLLDWRIKSVHK